MDPNANLEEQQRLVARIKRLSDNGEPDVEIAHAGYRLAELVEAMNNWIAGGGFLPTAWDRGSK